MAQPVKVLVTKTEDLNAIPVCHMEQGENQVLKIVL